MRIPFDIFSSKPREVWVDVPASLKNPLLGVGRVKLREIPKVAFDTFWAELVAAEQKVLDALRKGTPVEQATAQDEQRRAAHRLICVSVIDHDSASFEATLPPVAPGSQDSALVLAGLINAGYSETEAVQALEAGSARKAFKAAPWSWGEGSAAEQHPGAAEEMALFYERCTPDLSFGTSLLATIRRFRDGEVVPPIERWKAAGIKEEDIPPFFGGKRKEEST